MEITFPPTETSTKKRFQTIYNIKANMNQTENINELVAALCKAQGKMKPATFNKVNGGYKNKYADLASCMEACRGPLSENGLSIMQYVERIEGSPYLVTMLAHTSGQWMKSYLPMQPKNGTCQELGKEMTYLKRYGISAMIGIVADEEQAAEDDGEFSRKQEESKLVQKITPNQIKEINELLEQLDTERVVKFQEHIIKKYGKSSLDVIPPADVAVLVNHLTNAIKLKMEEGK